MLSRYREWVDKFSPSTQHLVLNDANSCMGSAAVHRIQYKLNLLHDDIFPLLGDHGTKIMSSTDVSKRKKYIYIKNDSFFNPLGMPK